MPQPGPSNYDVVSCETWPLALKGKDLHVWHSRDDELLSFKQSIDALLHLDEQLIGSTADAAVVQIPHDGLASTTTVDGEKKSVASLYGKVAIKNSDRLHADLTTLKVSLAELNLEPDIKVSKLTLSATNPLGSHRAPTTMSFTPRRSGT